VRILSFLTLPLGVAGLKSNFVNLITFVPLLLVVWLATVDSVELVLLVLLSGVVLLGTGLGTGLITSTQLKTLVPVILLNSLAPAEVDTKDFDPALNTQELKLPFHAEN